MMERLTTDKPTQEMSMLELSFNCMYAKDRRAYYRDYEREIDLRDFIREINSALGCSKLPTDDEEFDEVITDNLQHDPHSKLGLIALLNRLMWAMTELRERLKKYEDTGLTPERCAELAKAEKEGRLHIAPCADGTSIWEIVEIDEALSEIYERPIGKEIIEDTYFHGYTEYLSGELDTNWFLTRQEAEKALESEDE